MCLRIFCTFLVFSLFILTISSPSVTFATLADHVVISEWTTRGPGGSVDEFVELYNPTDIPVDISGWGIDTYGASSLFCPGWCNKVILPGTPDSGDVIIPPKQYLLIAESCGSYTGPTPDYWFVCSIGFKDDVGVIRLNATPDPDIFVQNEPPYAPPPPDVPATKIDYVAWCLDDPNYPLNGTCPDTIYAWPEGSMAEGGPDTYLVGGRGYNDDAKSVARKAFSSSGNTTMAAGGSDCPNGNGWDSDHNRNDFFVKTSREPQGLSTPAEYPVGPSVQASGILFSAPTTSSIRVEWASGDGTGRFVVARMGGAVDSDPVTCMDYSVDSVFGNGDEIGTGNYAVHAGSNNSVDITGLTSNTAYHLAVYEYTGTAEKKDYLFPPVRESFALVSDLTSQASQIVTQSWGTDAMDISWQKGSGPNSLVLMRVGIPVTADPVDGTGYTANSVFETGDRLGTGNYVVYNGSGNSVQVTGLTSSTPYHIGVYTYDGPSGFQNYLTPPAQANQSTLDSEPTTPPSALTFPAWTTDTLSLNWQKGNGSKCIVLMKEGSPVDASPVNANEYFAENSFGSGDELGTGNFVIYNGIGTLVQATGLQPETDYHLKVFSYNGSSDTTNYLMTPAQENHYTLALEPTLLVSSLSVPLRTDTSLTLNWQKGNGTESIVLMKNMNPVDGNPLDGQAYLADRVYGSGDMLDSGNYVVYRGSGTSVQVTNLNPDTVYFFAVYTLNGNGASTNYLLAPARVSASTLEQKPVTQASQVFFPAWTSQSLTVNWQSGSGAKSIILIRAKDAVDIDPADGTGYISNSKYQKGDVIGSDNYVVYNGSGNSCKITGLKSNTTYHVAVYSCYGEGETSNYLLDPARGSQKTSPNILLMTFPTRMGVK